jgi:hypothetical protein
MSLPIEGNEKHEIGVGSSGIKSIPNFVNNHSTGSEVEIERHRQSHVTQRQNGSELSNLLSFFLSFSFFFLSLCTEITTECVTVGWTSTCITQRGTRSS